MDRGKIIDICGGIFNLFVDQEAEREDVLQFLTWITKEKYDGLCDLIEDLKLGDEWATNILCGHVWMPLAYTGFGLGYVFGQLFEPTDPQMKEGLEFLKGVIKENMPIGLVQNFIFLFIKSDF